MSGQILIGDVLDRLATLPDESVNCVVTSPPYYGLRSYGVDGQIGLEPSVEEYLSKMVAVFREVRRVLRSDGVCWINLGDCYANGEVDRLRDDKRGYRGERLANGSGDQPAVLRKKTVGTSPAGKTQRANSGQRLKSKDMVGVPWRVALALQADGWWLRSDVIEEVEFFCPCGCGHVLEERVWRWSQDRDLVWAKSQPMPESVRDRPTKAHEYLFLMTKSATYAYDADAIKEPVSGGAKPRRAANPAMSSKDEGREDLRTSSRFGRGPGWRVKQNESFAAATGDLVDTRNKRSVWTIATQANPDAHFASFPEDLVTPCVLAGCPPGGVVLDPFGGTGTTARVAEDLGRRWILIEINPEYAAMADRRLAQRGFSW